MEFVGRYADLPFGGLADYPQGGKNDAKGIPVIRQRRRRWVAVIAVAAVVVVGAWILLVRQRVQRPVTRPASLQRLEELAKQGRANAQFRLGLRYEHGHGVPTDYAKAAKWFRKAAIQGDAVAQTHLGYCYGRGQGVRQSYQKAMIWFRKAAGWKYNREFACSVPLLYVSCRTAALM